MTIADSLMIIAVLVGPVIAVQLTRYIDERRENHKRKLAVFKTLMSTRASRLSGHHVEALNMIDLEFDKKVVKEKAVIEAWKSYLDSLADQTINKTEHGAQQQNNNFNELLYAMAIVLDYDFDKTHIKNAAYFPVGHGEWESQYRMVQRGLFEVLNEGKAINMRVTNLQEVTVPPAETAALENTDS